MLGVKNEKLEIRLEKNKYWKKENKIYLKQTGDHIRIKVGMVRRILRQ